MTDAPESRPADTPLAGPDVPTQDASAPRPAPAAPELSIVVPALDEEDNVGPLVDEVEQAVLGAGVDAELIVVDDGSRDRTLERLQSLAATRPWLVILHRDQPRGQSAAMYAGVQAARGAFVAFLDADLQNDPADLPRLLATLHEKQVDLVQGYRAKRKDTIVRKATSWVGRTTRNLLLRDPIRDTGCSTRVLRTSYARQLPLFFKGMHRFVPVYSRMLGATVAEVPVNHRPRTAGVAKYGILNRGMVGLFDCFTMRWMLKRYRDAQVTPMAATPSEGAREG